MRISDWSSDVCSSDLRELADLRERDATGELDGDASGELTEHQLAGLREPGQVVHAQDGDVVLVPTAAQVCQHRGVLGVLDLEAAGAAHGELAPNLEHAPDPVQEGRMVVLLGLAVDPGVAIPRVPESGNT